jgi:hypothetical protein
MLRITSGVVTPFAVVLALVFGAQSACTAERSYGLCVYAHHFASTF